MVKKVIAVVLTIVVLGYAIPMLWPLFIDTDTLIQAIEGADSATEVLQLGWPVALFIIAIGVVISVIYYAFRKFKVIGK